MNSTQARQDLVPNKTIGIVSVVTRDKSPEFTNLSIEVKEKKHEGSIRPRTLLTHLVGTEEDGIPAGRWQGVIQILLGIAIFGDIFTTPLLILNHSKSSHVFSIDYYWWSGMLHLGSSKTSITDSRNNDDLEKQGRRTKD
ncbi:hypothetical protein DFH09DRAFT_1091514 [Mycena vulgaris]|nr:hypothetical protein DFH09DRAFT_1091514 [Mycena vulgaris]